MGYKGLLEQIDIPIAFGAFAWQCRCCSLARAAVALAKGEDLGCKPMTPVIASDPKGSIGQVWPVGSISIYTNGLVINLFWQVRESNLVQLAAVVERNIRLFVKLPKIMLSPLRARLRSRLVSRPISSLIWTHSLLTDSSVGGLFFFFPCFLLCFFFFFLILSPSLWVN